MEESIAKLVDRKRELELNLRSKRNRLYLVNKNSPDCELAFLLREAILILIQKLKAIELKVKKEMT